MPTRPRRLSHLCLFALGILVALGFPRAAIAKRNIVFILVDDMRYDSMSNEGHAFLKTPHLDALAASGAKFKNAFVTTSLCSPSRATFLTGLYAHEHEILDNSTRLNPALPTFPVALRASGYQTAFIGKWHMGGTSDEPRPGFDHWASFKGQGDYFKNTFNINGEPTKVEGYVTDVTTSYSVDWLKKAAADPDRPFLLYMSHKAVHANFSPAPRHRAAFTDLELKPPASMADTPENYYRKPRWVKEQRDSWHGVNDMYFKRMSFDGFIRDYHRAMLAIDDSVGRVVRTLKELGLFESTLVVFTSDNGFLHGEHGLIDKRCMYEESIRIPLLMSCPEMFEGGIELDHLILNVDFAPTFYEAAGLDVPLSMRGDSFLKLPTKRDMKWRDSFLYIYFWERAYPETPTVFGVRTQRYKFMEYHGVWDSDELYDLEKDPREMHNLLSTPKRKRPVQVDEGYEDVLKKMRRELRRLRKELGVHEKQPNWGKR